MSFQFLAGSLALENRPFHFKAAEIVQSVFRSCSGYVAYKLTTLGRASEDDVPSFIVITKEHGIILIDVVEEQVLTNVEKDSSEYWQLNNGLTVPARSFIADIYSDEVVSRIKNDPSLYNRKTKSPKVPISSVLVFCSNKHDEVQRLTSEYQDLLD